MPKHKFSLAACARWEENDILEWLDYHRSIGVGHVYLYSNDDNASTLKNAIGLHLEGRAVQRCRVGRIESAPPHLRGEARRLSARGMFKPGNV